jgi:hypothetical protein
MRFGLWAGLVTVLWALTSTSANAFYPCCPVPCCIAYQACTVTCYRTEVREEKIPITIQRVNYRQEIDKVPIKVYVSQPFTTKVQQSYCVPVPKVIVRDVVTCVSVPIMMIDPCTGCCYVTNCPRMVTQQVSCTVYEPQMQIREIDVMVNKLVPQDRVIDRVRWVPVVTQEQSFTVRRYCVSIPYPVTVQVPVYVPCCQ